jgi:aminomethyltransferase
VFQALANTQPNHRPSLQSDLQPNTPFASSKKRVGLQALERVPVREHTALHSLHGDAIGSTTSGLLAPSVNRPIAMGYVRAEFSAVGTQIHAIVRGKPVPMEVVRLPFTPNRYYRG